MKRERSKTQLNLEEKAVRELKLCAARHEAEHREILGHAPLPSMERRSIKDLLLAMPEVGEDADFERTSDRGHDVDL